MGIVKKIKQLFNNTEEVVIAPEPVIIDLAAKRKYFDDFTSKSDIAKLFAIDPIPYGSLPVYDLEGGEKEIITIENGKPKYMKTEWNRITVQLQETITQDDLINCLLLAVKYAQPVDDANVEDYRNTGGWACVTGNKLENRLHKNIHIKDFPKTILLPEDNWLGVLCYGINRNVEGIGFVMVLEKVRVL